MASMGFSTSQWLTLNEIDEYRSLLEEEGIPSSDENVKALARLGAKNAEHLPRELIREHLAPKSQFPEELKELERLCREVASLKKLHYTESRREDPARVKFLKSYQKFKDVLDSYRHGEKSEEEMLYELANAIYYNTKTYQEDRDVRAHDVMVEYLAKDAGISPKRALAAGIGKYSNRVENAGMKWNDPVAGRGSDLVVLRKLIQSWKSEV